MTPIIFLGHEPTYHVLWSFGIQLKLIVFLVFAVQLIIFKNIIKLEHQFIQNVEYLTKMYLMYYHSKKRLLHKTFKDKTDSSLQ